MKLKVNNQIIETTATQLQVLAEELQLPAKGIALAVNQKMIPRTEWETFSLTEGMDIIIIKAVCGG